MSNMSRGEPKLLFPGLAGFYAAVSDLWYPMIRVAAGGFLLYHGWGKLMTGVAQNTVSNLTRHSRMSWSS